MSTDKPIDQYKQGKQIPSGRASRAISLVSLASSMAGGVVAEGISQFSKGQRPEFRDLLLTPSNARRLADKLMKLRGAALKVGQLLSMDAGEFIPKELSDILARLRDDVEPMPFSQLVQRLESEWGEDWPDRFSQFSYTPIAAASIGQVHSAHTKKQERIALKIQYPGVNQSIDSDVDNVSTLLRVSGLIPKESDIGGLLDETKRQLKTETDYLQEAKWIEFYRQALSDQSEFIVPQVHHDLTTQTILTMSYHDGLKMDQISHLPQEEKNRVVSLLIDLLLKEMFDMQCVQTDPNPANYLYDPASKKIVLLDFGATRKLPAKVSHAYWRLMSASTKNDKASINQACEEIGFFQQSIADPQREVIINLFLMACEPLKHNGEYDFGRSKLATNITQNAWDISLKKDRWHTPPADALFLHRKIAGMYLLAAKLKASVNIAALFSKYSPN